MMTLNVSILIITLNNIVFLSPNLSRNDFSEKSVSFFSFIPAYICVPFILITVFLVQEYNIFMECDSTTDMPENIPEYRQVGDISEMPLNYVTGNMPVTNRLEYMGQGSTWSRPPSPPQELDSTTADPEEDDDIEVIYDSEFGPYPPPLRNAHTATDIYGGFQDWNWHLPSSTTMDKPEPAFYAGSNNGDDEGYQMPTLTSADEPEPEVMIVYESRLDESQSAEMEQDD